MPLLMLGILIPVFLPGILLGKLLLWFFHRAEARRGAVPKGKHAKEELERIDWSDVETDMYGNRL